MKHIIKNCTTCVSIIIPVYNPGKYLIPCLNSVISQNLQNIEIICVDDCSADDSLKTLREYQKRDNRIIVITHENRGVATARNEGIDIACGQYVAFIDPDDWYPSETVLEHLYEEASSNHALICGGSMSFVTDDKLVWNNNLLFRTARNISYMEYQYPYFFQRFIYSRKMLIDNAIYHPKYIRFQDVPFMIEAMIKAEYFHAIPNDVYRYRNHNIVNYNALKIADILRALQSCLSMSSKNKLHRLHTMMADIIINEKYPIRHYLLFNNINVHEQYIKALLAIDYNVIDKSFALYAIHKAIISKLNEEVTQLSLNNVMQIYKDILLSSDRTEYLAKYIDKLSNKFNKNKR